MKNSERKALGRGLGALIPHAPNDSSMAGKGRLISLALEQLVLPESQPRSHFDESRLQELAASIRERGVLQPILVFRDGERYRLTAGERRVRAARIAQQKMIPAIIKDTCADDLFELALIENIQREDLGPIEEATAYQHLLEIHGYTQDELARRVGKQRSTIANSLRLLQLTPDVQAMLAAGRLTAGHGRALLTVTNPAERDQLLKEILHDGLSVRQAEQRARRSTKKTPPTDEPGRRGKTPPLQPLHDIVARELSAALEAPATVKPRSSRSGRIVIEYNSMETLRRIHERLTLAPTRDAGAEKDAASGRTSPPEEMGHPEQT